MTAKGRIPKDTFALRVWIVRQECGLSQREAAEKCGLTFGEWQGIESGRDVRSMHVKVSKIADALGYDRDWLMWGGPLVSETLGDARSAGLSDPRGGPASPIA